MSKFDLKRNVLNIQNQLLLFCGKFRPQRRFGRRSFSPLGSSDHARSQSGHIQATQELPIRRMAVDDLDGGSTCGFREPMVTPIYGCFQK